MRILFCLVLALFAQIGSAAASYAGSMEILKRPMTVTVVRGSHLKCEPLCPQWIAAEGQITTETPALFQKVLHELGDAKLPILLDSRGGDLDAAIAIGKMIHERKMTVAIASTGYINCDPRTQHCFKGGKPENIYRGFALHDGLCLSTCILVVAGGKIRLAKWLASDHLSTFDPKKSPEEIIAKIERYLAATMGNSAVLQLMLKATENEYYHFPPEILRDASIVTSDEKAQALVDRKSCEGAAPARNCVLAK
jgi:hypothetical protein